MKARDIMQGPVEDVMTFDNIYLAFGKMRSRGLHHLPVVDTKSQIVGILTDRDILRALAEVANLDAPMPLVSECMRKEVITCSIDDPIPAVVDKLLTHRINCLPVVDRDQRCLGMITSRDIIRSSLTNKKHPAEEGDCSTVKYVDL